MIKTVSRFNYHPPLAIDVAGKIAQSAKEIMQKEVEHIFVYADGQLLSSNVGNRRSVNFEREVLRDLPEIGIKYRTTLGHNHPSGRELSPDDMITSFGNNITDTFAVTPEGDCYVMTLPKLNFKERQEIDFSLHWPFFKNKGIRLFCKLLSDVKSDRIKKANIEKFKKMFEGFGAKFNKVKVDELAELLTRKS